MFIIVGVLFDSLFWLWVITVADYLLWLGWFLVLDLIWMLYVVVIVYRLCCWNLFVLMICLVLYLCWVFYLIWLIVLLERVVLVLVYCLLSGVSLRCYLCFEFLLLLVL